jgi:hypothetical protein
MDASKIEKIMVCPKCQGKVEVHNMFIVCEKCKLAYPVIDDIPDMLIEDAWNLGKARKNKFKHTLKL